MCNGDGYLDMVVCNSNTMNVAILLGHGNGTFQAPKLFYIGSNSDESNIVIGDFNSDNRSDIVFSNLILNVVGVMFGDGNGNLDKRSRFLLETGLKATSVSVSDFNCDGHLDIVVGQTSPHSIGLLVGHGNGNFDTQTIFSTQTYNYNTFVAVADLNGDECQDIIVGSFNPGITHILLNTCECCTARIVKTTTAIY